MKTLYPVEILLTDDGIKYNYNGTLYTKEQFEEKYLNIYEEKIRIVHDKKNKYWYLWHIYDIDPITDDDGNLIHFKSLRAAKQFLKGGK